MADQKITALTSLTQADIVSGTDVLPIVDVGAPSVTKKATPKAVVGASVNDLAQTWNAGGTTFTAVKMDVTDTASASASLLIDLQVGGASQFNIKKDGTVTSNVGSGVTYPLNISRTSSTVGPFLKLEHIRTTPAAATMGGIQFFFTDSASATKAGVGINAISSNVTVGAEETRASLSTYVAGAFAGRVNIGAGIWTPAATGGDQGVDTINAAAVYDDGVLLTCYVLEAWLTGGIDVDFWDGVVLDRQIPAVVVEREPGNFVEVEPARVEERRHERARGFANVAADRLDIDKFAEFLRTNKRLPAFPGPEQWNTVFSGKMATGDLLQRIWETCEVLAVHLVEARGREVALEARITALENAGNI